MSDDYYARNGDHSPGPSGPVVSQALAEARRFKARLHSDCMWIDGELVPLAEATVHILNPTLHYGPGVFEGIRCYETARGPALFRLEAHLKRFLQAVQRLGVQDLPQGLVDLRRAAHVTVQANNLSSCYVRPVLYFTGAMGLDLDSYRPSVAVAAWKWDGLTGEVKHETGVRVMVTSLAQTRRNADPSEGSVTNHYANTIMAKATARRAGFDEAILLDDEGRVAQCTGENLFIAHDGVLYTPPRPGTLEDVARDTVVTLATDLGYTVIEERLSRDQLLAADEAFLCSTATEVVPVREIDSRLLSEGRIGPLTRAIQHLYFNTVRGLGRRSRGWLEYVMMEPLF